MMLEQDEALVRPYFRPPSTLARVPHVRVGTRRSQLAVVQTESVCAAILRHHATACSNNDLHRNNNHDINKHDRNLNHDVNNCNMNELHNQDVNNKDINQASNMNVNSVSVGMRMNERVNQRQVKNSSEMAKACAVSLVMIETTGDKVLDRPLHRVGDKALFTKELEDLLARGSVDIVVHSLKDLPTTLPDGCCIGAVLQREDPRDVVLFTRDTEKLRSCFKTSHEDINLRRLEELPSGSVIGTSSVRRIAQLKHFYPHLCFVDIRGNLNTRLKKLDDPSTPYTAIILAYAGVKRLGWSARIDQILTPFPPSTKSSSATVAQTNHTSSPSSHGVNTLVEIIEGRPVPVSEYPFYYAVGQGALAVESLITPLPIPLLPPHSESGSQSPSTNEPTLISENDETYHDVGRHRKLNTLLSLLTHSKTFLETASERSLMRSLEGGCSVPIGVATQWNLPSSPSESEGCPGHDGGNANVLCLYALVSSLDGHTRITASSSRSVITRDDAEELGREVAEMMKQKGAVEILREIREKKE